MSFIFTRMLVFDFSFYCIIIKLYITKWKFPISLNNYFCQLGLYKKPCKQLLVQKQEFSLYFFLFNLLIVSNLVRNFVPEKSHKSIMLR